MVTTVRCLVWRHRLPDHLFRKLTKFSCLSQILTRTLQFSGWTVFLKGQWDRATFVTNYLPLALFPLLYIISRIVYRVQPVKPLDMDFVTNIDEIEAETYVGHLLDSFHP